MPVFNPRILEACIRDVTVRLTDHQKVSILLHALERLPTEGGSREIMESSVQALLKVNGLPPADLTKALVLRAKTRLVAGYRTSAQQDLHSVLTLDPDNQEVKAIIHSQHLRPEMLLREPNGPPRFSIEVWTQITLFLPKRDLKSLLQVPHPISRIASQLLFREIDLHLTPLHEPTGMDSGVSSFDDASDVDRDLDNWHHQRSADILTRILVDPQFAGQIRSLGIHAASHNLSQSLTFQVGMLLNALPKLSNLKRVHCSGSRDLILRAVRCIHKCIPKIQELSLELADPSVDIDIPRFKHLTHFSLTSEGGDPNSTHIFIAHSRDTLRALAIQNSCWHFPADSLSLRQLSCLEFGGHLTTEMFSEILSNGYQLDSLKLSGSLECSPSPLFRQHQSALPFLRHLHIRITSLDRHVHDRDLCPSISEFVRHRTQLRTYHLFLPCGSENRRIGFDASAWGVLPALSQLRSLAMTIPCDLALGLAGWLVPRNVSALVLDMEGAAVDVVSFLKQIRPGIPTSLKYVGITNMRIRSAQLVVEHGFPQVRVVAIGHNVWSVIRGRSAESRRSETLRAGASAEEMGQVSDISMEQWPYRRVRFHQKEWLELMECEDAVWKGVNG
ncbi:hypothetical protein EDC04DRAFT_2899819 [Pisolithus marmoratus]|nr:hypothetical protein EDC04DRAFT_2899819 [Pisolithus marmoratus]